MQNSDVARGKDNNKMCVGIYSQQAEMLQKTKVKKDSEKTELRLEHVQLSGHKSEIMLFIYSICVKLM